MHFRLPQPYGRFTAVKRKRLVIEESDRVLMTVEFGWDVDGEFVSLRPLPGEVLEVTIDYLLPPETNTKVNGLLARHAYAAAVAQHNIPVEIPADWELEKMPAPEPAAEEPEE